MEWLSYLLEVSVCMAFFYAFYFIALRKLSFFSFSRYYLLSSLIASLLIPTLQMKIESRVNLQQHVSTTDSPIKMNHTSSKASTLQQRVVGSTDYKWLDFLPLVYWLAVMGCFVALSCRFIHLARQFRKPDDRLGQLKIVYKSTGFTNCSFFNYVFVDHHSLSTDELDVILRHESIHAKKFHSLDKVFIQVILWFNPFVYLFGKALEEMHEYEADQEASSAVGNTFYAKILLSIAIQKHHPALLHSFVRDQVKARINMLFTNQSKNMKKLMYLFALPMGLGLVALFGVEVVYAKPVTALSKSVEITRIKDKPEDKLQKVQTPVKTVKSSIVISPQEKDQDTIRMIGRDLGLNPKVTIDGTNYPSDILTRISPRCIYTTSGSADGINITTHGNKIEYATKTDIENVKTEINAEKSTAPYIRYTLKNEGGEKFDRVKIRTKSGSASLDLPKNAKVLILIEGKIHSEKDAAKLNPADLEGMTTINASGSLSNYAQYGTDYHGVIEIKKE